MKKYLYTIAILIATITIIPSAVHAATVYLESSKASMSIGDTAIITVKINADGATINTVEGNIILKSSAKNLTVQEFSLANSAFGLWPRTPSLSSDGKIVSFVGGVPGGFNIEGATLFKIIVKASEIGSVTISPQDLAVFLNDGKGTKVTATTKDVAIQINSKQPNSVIKDDWNDIVTNDKIPPEDFIVVMGQDSTLFEGKKFAFFSALDNQTGISHYEVSENGAPAVRSGSTYVLQNQDSVDVRLEVIAFDKAGNKKITKYSPAFSWTDISWQQIIIIFLILVIGWLFIRRLRRK